MGMDIRAKFSNIKPVDKKFDSMKEIADKCRENDIPIPDKVLSYFGVDDEDDLEITDYGFKCGELIEDREFFTTDGDCDSIECHEKNQFIIDLQSVDKDVRYLCVDINVSI